MLSGIRVVELASVLAGPSVGQFLGELGAEVVKVESPSGDVTRTWKLPVEENDEKDTTAYFHAANLGKKSISVDARHPKGREVISRLADSADVVLASYKPGDAAKLGVDYATLRRTNPRLIYASISGYGAANPRVGYDAVVQAESGFQYMNGDPEGGPTKLPVALMDLLAAHQLKQALLLALWRRDRDGVGGEVHASLMRSAVSSLANQATGYLRTGTTPRRIGSDHPAICPYGTVFRTADAKLLTLAVGSDKQYASLCGVLGLQVLPEHATNPQRVVAAESCKKLVADAVGKWRRTPLLEALGEASVPAGAVNTMDDVFSDQPEAELAVVRDQTGACIGLKQCAFEFLGEEGAGIAPRPPPSFSQDARQILSGLGYSARELEALEADTAVVFA